MLDPPDHCMLVKFTAQCRMGCKLKKNIVQAGVHIAYYVLYSIRNTSMRARSQLYSLQGILLLYGEYI